MKKSGKESLNEIIEKLDKLTTAHKIIICVATYAIIIIPFVFFSFKPNLTEIKKLEKKLADVEKKLQTAKRKADRLEEVKAEWEKATEQFLIARQSLPEEQQIPDLLDNISKSGLQSGLEFKRFRPSGSKDYGFFQEMTINVEVTGGFHNFLLFCDKLANLTRIVKVRNISMSYDKNKVNTSCQAVTYKFVQQN